MRFCKYIDDILQFANNKHYKLRSTNKGDLKRKRAKQATYKTVFPT